ncbi:MAG: HPF/RaiA family ribosome-associated protein [Kofleriaceae bacterium]
MQIQIHTDKNIDGHERFNEYVKRVVSASLDRFADRITRIEVHLSDENGAKEGKGGDKRCVMEARLEHRQPSAVTHHADSLNDAIDGAVAKLEHMLDSTVGKLYGNHR